MRNYRQKLDFMNRTSGRSHLRGAAVLLALGLLSLLPAAAVAQQLDGKCTELRGRALLKNVEEQLACRNDQVAGTSLEQKCLSRAESKFKRRWDSKNARAACRPGPANAGREVIAFADELAREIPQLPGLVGGPIDPEVLEPLPEPDPGPEVEGPAGLRAFYLPFCVEGQPWDRPCLRTLSSLDVFWRGPWPTQTDMRCQSAARHLPGYDEAHRAQFKAWLGRSRLVMNPNGSVLNGRPPKQLLAEGLVDADRPILLPSGKLVADDWADLVDGRIRHPIDEFSDGVRVGARYAITGARTDGRPAGDEVADFCNSYTGLEERDPQASVMVGKTTARGRGWTAAARVGCGPVAQSSVWQNAGIYCFEVTNARVHEEVYSNFPFLDAEPSLLD